MGERDVDAQSIQQLVRSCIRDAARVATRPADGLEGHVESAGTKTEETEEVRGRGIVADEPAPGVLPIAAVRPADSAVRKSMSGAIGNGHERIPGDSTPGTRPEGTGTASDAGGAGGTASVSTVRDEQMQPAKTREAHSAASWQLLQALRPLAQRSRLEAQVAARADRASENTLLAEP